MTREQMWSAAVEQAVRETRGKATPIVMRHPVTPAGDEPDPAAEEMATAITIASAVVIELCRDAGHPVEALGCAIAGLERARDVMMSRRVRA